MVPCFDLCCAAGSGCAHPATPGGPSACMLSPNPPPRPCKDGEPLDTGCACVDGGHCMDLCCVGSACSHASSPDGGSAKCVKIPKRR